MAVFVQSSEKTYHTVASVSHKEFDVHCKTLTLTHPIMGQTSKSDTLRPTWRLMKSRGASNLHAKCSSEIQDSGHPVTSKARMYASKCRVLTFDPQLDVSGSVFSSARQISLVRHTCNRMVKLFPNFGQKLPLRKDLNVTCLRVLHGADLNYA